MDTGQALRELGVTAGLLTAADRARLDADGFLPMPGVLHEDQLQVIRQRLAELSAAEGDRAGLEVHQEEGTDRLADLVNKDPVFEVCFASPRVLAAGRPRARRFHPVLAEHPEHHATAPPGAALLFLPPRP